jgi:hypothetical protein
MRALRASIIPIHIIPIRIINTPIIPIPLHTRIILPLAFFWRGV